MDNTHAPDKHEPHVFEASPEVPIVYPRTGTMLQQGLPGQGTGLGQTANSRCMICGGAPTDRIHLQSGDSTESGSWPL